MGRQSSRAAGQGSQQAAMRSKLQKPSRTLLRLHGRLQLKLCAEV